jgi:UDPglucose--hexose-1-phosphate uridylyltransferase
MPAPSTFIAISGHSKDVTIYAPERAGLRPFKHDRGLATERNCPFCPGSAELPEPFDVVLLENKFPSLSTDTDWGTPQENRLLPGYGKQDVFLYSPDHHRRLHDTPVSNVAALLTLLGERVAGYYRDERIQHAFAFEVSGGVFGPTIEHPHGQVFGLPLIPPGVRLVPDGPCLTCEEIRQAATEGRLVARDELVSVYVPLTARAPLELWVVPNAHAPDLWMMPDHQVTAIAAALSRTMRAFASFGWPDFSYMIAYRHAPRPRQSGWHFRIEVCPAHRLNGAHKYFGAMEIALGVFLMPTDPRSAATLLRNRWDDIA